MTFDHFPSPHRGLARGLLLALAFLAGPAHAATYEVGPTSTYASIGAVPWESLGAGDTVLIHARPQPYAEKWVICAQGTAASPVRVVGVPDAAGNLPIITGENATTRAALRFANQERSLIKIGSATVPSCSVPRHVIVENLHLRRARNTYGFRGPTGTAGTYTANAAAIFVQAGEDITIRGCVLEDSGNGLFSAVSTARLTVENNLIQGNGNPGSIYEHNVYTAAHGIVFRGNRIMPLCSGCSGNALKDRSSGTVIQANWIEGGNRQLDLVEGEDDTSLAGEAAYGDTYVAGNILIEKAGGGNSQIVHFGGDHDDTNIPIYRPRLWFWNNTVVSWRTDNTTVFRLSTPNQKVFLHNNVFWASAGGSRLGLLDRDGAATYGNNWLPTGWKVSHGGATGAITNAGGNLVGSTPGFRDASVQDFGLAAGSACIGAAGALPAQTSAMPLSAMYVPHQHTVAKAGLAPTDLGAFWAGSGAQPPPPPPPPPVPAPAAIAALSVSPGIVVGGSGASATVTLSAAAPAGGAAVSLSSASPSVIVPGSVTVPAGATQATFAVSTSAVTVTVSATVSAAYGGATRSAILTVTPPAPPPAPAPTATLSSISLSPTSISGGGTVTGTVLLTGPAPAGGAVIALTSSSPGIVPVPATVTVPAGATSARFTSRTVRPGYWRVVVRVSATYAGVTRTAAVVVRRY